MEKEQYLEVYRHSLAHILAKAVIELYGPETQYAIGPQIDDGFITISSFRRERPSRRRISRRLRTRCARS